MDDEEQRIRNEELLVPAVDEVRMYINTEGSLVFASLDPADRETSVVIIPRGLVPQMIARARKLIKESAADFK